MAMMMEMLVKKQRPNVTQNAIWSPARKKDLGVAVLALLGQSQNSLDFVALIEESDESKSDQELKESVIEDFKPHLHRDDGVDLLDETPPDSLVAERHCSISPLKVVRLLSHGKSIGQELPHQCSIYM